MSTEIETTKPAPIEYQVAEWSATDAGLRAAVESTAGISVEAHAEGPANGYKAVEAARKMLKVHRTAIEGRRKELKAPILKLGKLVDSEAERLTAIVEPRELELAQDAKAYEDKLAAERQAEEGRLAAERAEAERLARERLQSRVDAVKYLGGNLDIVFLQTAGEDEMEALLARLRTEKEERDAIAAKEEAERVERERLEEIARQEREEKERTEREEREAEERRVREEQEAAAKLERERLAAERAEMDRRQAELDRQEREISEAREKAEREAREKAEAEERAVREAERLRQEVEKAEREAEEARKAEAERLAMEEARRPDLEKVSAWANAWLAARPDFPEISDTEISQRLQLASAKACALLESLT